MAYQHLNCSCSILWLRESLRFRCHRQYNFSRIRFPLHLRSHFRKKSHQRCHSPWSVNLLSQQFPESTPAVVSAHPIQRGYVPPLLCRVYICEGQQWRAFELRGCSPSTTQPWTHENDSILDSLDRLSDRDGQLDAHHHLQLLLFTYTNLKWRKWNGMWRKRLLYFISSCVDPWTRTK